MSAFVSSTIRSVRGPAATMAAGVATLFRRSLAVRVDEQRTRIERTGLAGMI